MRWSWGWKSADKAVCAAESLALSGGDVVALPAGASLAGMRGGLQAAAGACRGWSGQHPCPVVAGEAAADEVAQVEGCGAVFEPGVVAGGAEIAESEAPPAAAGDLGDHPFDVGAELPVVLTQPGLGCPAGARGAQQVVAGVQDELAASLTGGAFCPQRAAAAQGAEGSDPGAAERHGAASGAGDRALVLADGEVIDGEPALDRRTQRLGLDHRLVPGLLDRIAQVTGAVGGIAVPGQWLLPAAAAVACRGIGAVAGSLGGQELLGHRGIAVVLPGGPG